MEEKNPSLEEQEQDKTLEFDYLQKIKELKENSVSKEVYNKLAKEHAQAVDMIINGVSSSTDEVEEPKEDVDKIIADTRKELFSGDYNGTNLEFWEKTLKLRDKLIEKGEKDPFLPYGTKVVATDEDIASAERVAKVVKECIDYAEGDSAIFTNELQRRMVDTVPLKSKYRR